MTRRVFRLFILMVSLFSMSDCTTDRPGPQPVIVSNASITKISELIQARCSTGADIVTQSLRNINLPQGPDTYEVFASHEFTNCKKGRKVRFTSLIYEMRAERVFPNGKTVPLDLVQSDQIIRVKKIMSNDFSTGIDITPQLMDSRAHITIRVTPHPRSPGTTVGIPMDRDTWTFSLLGRFNREQCQTPCADIYATRLTSIQAVDENGKNLLFTPIDDTAFTLHIAGDYRN